MKREGHAILGASTSPKWLLGAGGCAASVRMERGLPEEPSSEAAEEGTRGHDLAYRGFLRGGLVSYLGLPPAYDDIELYPAEMWDHIEAYQQYVWELTEGAEFVAFEHPVEYTDWVPDGFGTADVIYVKDRAVGNIDLKYGFKRVLASGPQNRLYGLGAYQTLEPWFAPGYITHYTGTIYQPRLDHIDTETMPIEELLHWGESVVRPGAALALSEDAPFNPNEQACQWCKARFTCKPRADLYLEMAMDEFADPDSTDDTMTDADYVRVLTRHRGMKQWLEDMTTQATTMAMSGHTFPGFKLVRAKGRETWIDKEAALTTLKKSKLKKEMYIKEGLKALSEIRKEWGAEKLAPLLHRPEGSISLVPESHRSPAYVPLEAAQDDFAEAPKDDDMMVLPLAGPPHIFKDTDEDKDNG